MVERSASMSSAIDRTAPSDDVIKKINHTISWFKVLEAQLVLLKSKIAKERESNKFSNSNLGEVTAFDLSQTYYDQVLKHWTAIQNLRIRVKNENNKLYNCLVAGVMGPPLPDPEVEAFRKQIIELGDQITPLQIISMELTQDKERLDFELMEKKRELKVLMAQVGEKLEQAESHTHPREVQRMNERLMKIKIVRCVINTLLARAIIDYEEHPELKPIKFKWRRAITLKPKRGD